MASGKRDKRMDAFAREAFRLGSLTGFKHFRVELRGREELLLTVWPAQGAASASLAPMSSREALPPASPCARERQASQWEARGAVVFLIGAYAHYAIPYVWVRAGHARVARFVGGDDLDTPIQVECTQEWDDRTVRVWEVVAELVCKVAAPMQICPFELEFSPPSDLSEMELLLSTGALCAFLRDVHASSTVYSQQVEPDLMTMLGKLAITLNDFALTPKMRQGIQISLSSELRQHSQKSAGSSPSTPFLGRASSPYLARACENMRLSHSNTPHMTRGGPKSAVASPYLARINGVKRSPTNAPSNPTSNAPEAVGFSQSSGFPHSLSNMPNAGGADGHRASHAHGYSPLRAANAPPFPRAGNSRLRG